MMFEGDKKIKDLLAKPNQLIEIEGALSLGQLKVYNVLLAEAHRSIQGDKKRKIIDEDTTRESYAIDYKELKKRAGINEKDDKKIRRYIEEIRGITITLRDKYSRDWSVLGLISQARYRESEGKIHIELPSIIRRALYSSNYYTTLDLQLIKTLRSKYSVILYELIKKYEGVQIPTYDITSFSKIFQTNYTRFGDIKRKILDIAISELEEKTEYKIGYETSKIGKRIAYVKLRCRKVDVKDEVKEVVGGKDRIEGAIKKAKRNIYISKTWDSRTDRKIEDILEKRGEECVVELLERAYTGCQRALKFHQYGLYLCVLQLLNLIFLNHLISPLRHFHMYLRLLHQLIYLYLYMLLKCNLPFQLLTFQLLFDSYLTPFMKD